MKKTMLILGAAVILSISANVYQYLYCTSLIDLCNEKESKIRGLSKKYVSKGEQYVGKWRQKEDTNTVFVLKKAGRNNYLVRLENDEEADVLCYFEDGIFKTERENYELFFTNGDTLESLSKTYLRH